MYTSDYTPKTSLKSVFIAYNQAYHPLILRILRHLSLKGYTSWAETPGQGTHQGDPHLGSHAWPTMNSSMLVVIPGEKVPQLLSDLKALDEATPEQGLRAFVWSIEQTI
ncbi:PG0541 family transporter-associated protein [Porphyromonas sp. COT-290 OH860]|uniref:PG0541 family transporter-associated protein n=1 Tax=Porphyromonas sp. COT-290 OH860 TaxID=1515615 RepID=UPI0005C4C023|nr:PG0541 family transporter-associated protein [Porphyromonas sp. COT-290 OH860]